MLTLQTLFGFFNQSIGYLNRPFACKIKNVIIYKIIRDVTSGLLSRWAAQWKLNGEATEV